MSCTPLHVIMAVQVAVVKAAATADQQIWRSTLSAVEQETAGVVLSPCTIVFGKVAGLPDQWAISKEG